MGSHRPAVETPCPCLTAEKDADFSPHSSCHPPCPCLLCPPEQTQPDQGPTPGSEPEPTQHQVLHRQPGHRLRGLGSCPGGRHPILRQPGVQPVQEQGRHQEHQHQGHQQSDLRQLQHWQRNPRIPWRLCRRFRGSECRHHLQLRVNKEKKENLVNSKLVIDSGHHRLCFCSKARRVEKF